MQKTILVIGATGYLGGKVIGNLLNRNVKIRVLVRPETDSGELKKSGIEICNGDLTKPVQ
ncbi:hopanoid-associated sugar epimerase [compost metagenome]